MTEHDPYECDQDLRIALEHLAAAIAERDAARAELAQMTDTASRWNATAKVFEHRLDAVIEVIDHRYEYDSHHDAWKHARAAATGDTK